MGNPVEIDNDSYPAWRLFHIPYRVKIPEVYFYDPEWVAVYGRPTSGNKKIDKALLNTSRTVWWTVDNITEIFSLGAEVTFVNYSEDPYLIYTDIQSHLEDWGRLIKFFDQSLNKFRGEVPTEDLIKFSAFADALFPLTQGVDPITLQSGRVANHRTFNRKNRFVKHKELPQEKPDTYQLDGSHVFTPGFLDTNPEPVILTKEQKLEYVKENLKDKHHKSFTEIFENFMFSSAPKDIEE